MLHPTATILLAALVGLASTGCPSRTTTGADLPADADDGAGVTFLDLTANEASGIDYRRVPSVTNAAYEQIKTEPRYTMPLIVDTPEKPRGSPGVAVLDFDGDGDLDLYVTNGPGAANSLYASRLEETGTLRFEDVAVAAGVAAIEQDSTGVCFGDLENDGDPDLVVLGRSEPNRLFENLGDGTFRDATAESGVGESDFGHTDCSVGDVDGDGLLDLAIANSYDWSRRVATLEEPWDHNHPNQLFLNQGGLRFRDVSASSGILDLNGFQPPQDGAATVTWALALVDYDQDGDLDLLQADDQGGIPPEKASRGLIQVLNNDGTGQFTAVTDRVGTDLPGTSWMGFAFADFNCDGHMDFFATNMGDYAFSAIGMPFIRGQLSSRAFFGTPRGAFEDAGPGGLRATPFGWSVMAPDLDNDGDADVVFFGGLDGAMHTITADNPGAVLLNPGCSADFEADLEALAVDHTRRNVHGGATGDLNRDGFPDLVTASSFRIPDDVPLQPYPVDYDSPFDASAWFVEAFAPEGRSAFTWNGLDFPDGRLAVEINNGNDNHWVEVRLLGMVGVLPAGRVNRDGVGAVIRVTPQGGRTSLRPVTGGSSFASQNAPEQLFGLGRAATATVEVMWPGGIVNRLHGVRAGERIVFPEIPCDAKLDGALYRSCLTETVEQLRSRDLLSPSLAERFVASADDLGGASAASTQAAVPKGSRKETVEPAQEASPPHPEEGA
ncbi:MAG: CRTAC1 family protein [Acidobacteriota bacterium]